VEILLAALVGVLMGAALMYAVHSRRSAPAALAGPAPAPELVAPDAGLAHEVTALLAVLRTSGIVLDEHDAVMACSPTAVTHGLVRGDEVAHRSLLELAQRARREADLVEEQLWLPRGPNADARRVVSARSAPLGAGHTVLLVEDRSHAFLVEEVRRDFLANVSHELKTPVGGLLLLSEALRGAKNDPEAVARFAKRMRKEAQRLDQLVSDIVQLSRLQSEDRLSEPEAVDLREVVAEAVDDVRFAAEEKNIDLSVSTQDDPWVWGDAKLLVTAVRNLAVNAVAYSGPDTAVSVEARVCDDGDREISVTDEGQGIAPAEQGRIFERFYRVDAARSRATGGTGLGLSIVKHVCANHGGDVSVRSELGHGSTFTMRLPAPAFGPGSPGIPSLDKHDILMEATT
jgi:two-component system sensor histidine kinase SenX3